MHFKELDNAIALQARGRQQVLFLERKKRLDAFYAEYRKYADLAQQDDSLIDVMLEMNKLMDEIEEINAMIRQDKR